MKRARKHSSNLSDQQRSICLCAMNCQSILTLKILVDIASCAHKNSSICLKVCGLKDTQQSHSSGLMTGFLIMLNSADPKVNSLSQMLNISLWFVQKLIFIGFIKALKITLKKRSFLNVTGREMRISSVKKTKW